MTIGAGEMESAIVTQSDVRSILDTEREFLEITFNTIDEGITIYDKNLRLVIWNQQYAQMGITPKEDLYRGASLLDSYVKMAHLGIFGDGDPDKLARMHIESLKSGPLIESEFLNALNSRLIRINRFRLRNGGICATFRDITEEQKNEQLLRQAAKLEAIGQLAGGLAHDLNNVLAIIIGSLENAQDDQTTSESQIGTAIAAADQGAQLIHSLLAFARQQPLETVVIQASDPLNRLKSMLPKLIGEKIAVSIVCDANLWLTEIDGNLFESTILNLVVNARDAMPDGGQLTIEARNTLVEKESAHTKDIPPGQYVCVSVTDSGVGMTAQTVEKAFDPFFTTKRADAGTGLGLSMAHGFAKQSGGQIRIDSEEGAGTTVRLYLPRTLVNQSVNTSDIIEAIKYSELSVLVVEDDDSLRESVATQVRSLGCTVVSASSGEEALQLTTMNNIDVLLTDVVMPGLSGQSLAEAAILANPQIAVVYMSGYSENVTDHQGKLDSGAVFLKKPFRRINLSNAFQEALNRSS